MASFTLRLRCASLEFHWAGQILWSFAAYLAFREIHCKPDLQLSPCQACDSTSCPAVCPASFSFPVWTVCVSVSLWHITRWQLSHSFNWLAGDGQAGGQRKRWKCKSRQRKWETLFSISDTFHITPHTGTFHEYGTLWCAMALKKTLEAKFAQKIMFYVVRHGYVR